MTKLGEKPQTPTQESNDELGVAFGRMLGLVAAAIILTIGGGVIFILLATVVARFMFGG